jgi:hypothetical protein
MKKLVIVASIFLFVIHAGVVSQEASLSGTVVWNDTADVVGKPLPGCTVVLKNAGLSTTTNFQGVFSFERVSAAGKAIRFPHRMMRFANGELTFTHTREVAVVCPVSARMFLPIENRTIRRIGRQFRRISNHDVDSACRTVGDIESR